MKKLFYLGFCLVLAMGVGCAITNYDLIVDNNQVKQQKGAGPVCDTLGLYGYFGHCGFVVNTSGKAHIIEGSQAATGWPDGYDEIINFVDQKANGDRVLTTYDNFSADFPIFHSDVYCNPDWQGCAVTTSQDPQVGDASIFDYSLNAHCFGARSLSLLLSTYRFYGECGRSIDQFAAGLSMLEKQGNSYYILLTPANTNALLRSMSDGTTTAVGLNFDIPVTISGNIGNAFVKFNASNPLVSALANQLNQVVSQHGSGFNTTVQVNGLSKNFSMKFNQNLKNLMNQ